MKPQMLPKEVKKIEGILMSFGGHIDVLEWGSGGSTVYFTEFLRRHSVSYMWTSIEYNKIWYQKILDATKNDLNTKLHLFDVGNTDVKQRYVNMDEYVLFPGRLDKKYDVIIVDGRKRRRCLLEAKKILKDGGVVILHDARRTYYHCAFNSYSNWKIELWSGLWLGRTNKPKFLDKQINFINYWCFRVHTFSFRFLR